MKNLLFLFFIVLGISVKSQVSSYTFSETTGTYTSITGGTQLVTTTGGITSYDTDGSYFTLPAGSQFTFNGVTITSVNMTADGAIWLNPLTTTTGNGTTGPISSTGSASGIIAAMAMDLRSTSLASQIYERRWQDVGTEVVFQWQNAARYLSDATERFSFQIRVTKSTGVIRIVYGNMTTIANSTTYQPMVGLRGSVNTDYNNRRLTGTVPDAAPNWGAPNGTTAGTSNAHTVRFTSASSCFPVSGLIFVWTPPSCIAPTSLIISYTSPTSANLSWTAPSPAPSNGYDWEMRTSGLGGSGATGLAASGSVGAGITTASTSSLTQNTAYILYVRSNCGGTYSSWVASTSSTSPTPPPSNDACSNSISLPCGTSSLSGTTVGSVLETAPGGGGLASNYGVWYSFTGDGQLTTISTTGTGSFDQEMTIVQGTCGSNTLIVSLDAGGSNGTETYTFISTSGLTYYVYVAYFSSVGTSTQTGTFTISRTCTPVPSNNSCSTPTSLSVQCPGSNTMTSGTTIGATEDAISKPTCDNIGTIQDIWYSFNPGNNTQIDITVTLGTASWIGGQIFSSCGTVATGLNTSCDFNLLSPSPTTITGLTMNTNYLLRIWTNSTYDTPGTFSIRLNTLNNTSTLTSSGGTISQTVCQGIPISNITYSTTGATGSTFSGLPSGISGSWNNNIITISGTPTISGNFSYTATLTGGCSNVTSSGTITVNPSLGTLGSISGNSNIIAGTTEIYSISPVSGSPTYQWDYVDGPMGVWNTGVSSTTSVSISWPLTTTSGAQVKITASNSCGSDFKILNINVDGVLPVELLYFEGIPYSSFNLLRWSTASENHSDYFEILESQDGDQWKCVAIESAAGNSNQKIDYSSSIDISHFKINYYQLKQIDYDGNFKIYGPISLDNRKNSKKVMKYVNVLGQDVNPDTNGTLFEIYDDGTSKMIFR